jgi:hypothetical protein
MKAELAVEKGHMTTRSLIGVLGLIALCSIGCGHAPSSGNPVTPTPDTSPRPSNADVTITGTVVEIGGGPVEGASIQTTTGGERAVSDASGAFSFTVPASSVANLNLRVSKAGYDTAYASPLRTGVLKIELQRQRQVTGRVLDTEGIPVPDLDVLAGGIHTKTDANGAFVATAGLYLTLQKDGFHQRIVVPPPGQDIALGDLRIQRSITLTGPSHFSFVLSENDPEEAFFEDADENLSCFPCKWLDVVSGGQLLQIDIHASAPGPFEVSSLGDFYSTPTRTQIGPGEFDLRVVVPASTHYLLVGLKTTPGVPVPLKDPVTFDVTVTVPGT